MSIVNETILQRKGRGQRDMTIRLLYADGYSTALQASGRFDIEKLSPPRQLELNQ